MTKNLLLILMCGAMFALMSSPTFGLQSGGVEIGDLETGSVAGQPFRKLEVDVELVALCVGGQKAWYPPTIILNLSNQGTGSRAGRPIIIKVTNKLPTPQGFSFSADSSFAGPTSLNVALTLNPGETKYIGVPISDLTYVTAGGTMTYHSHLDPSMMGGQLVILK